MNKSSFFLLATCCLNAFGQTNAPSVPRQLLSLPRVELRMAAIEPEQPESGEPRRLPTPPAEQEEALSRAPAAPNPTALPGEMTLNSEDRNAVLYRRLVEAGCFTRPEPPSDSRFVRAVNNIFEPEVIRIGRTSKVSCSVITAIKRKNPLCLLNPLVLNISW